MVFRKTSKKFGLSHSRYVPPVSRAPASELVLQRGGLPSDIALPGEASSPKLYTEGWVPTLKNKNIFSANNEQSSMKRGEKWFSEKLRKNLDLENFRSDSRLILDTYLLYRELPLPSSCCKGEACIPRSHYQGKPRVQNCVSRGGCRL